MKLQAPDGWEVETVMLDRLDGHGPRQVFKVRHHGFAPLGAEYADTVDAVRAAVGADVFAALTPTGDNR